LLITFILNIIVTLLTFEKIPNHIHHYMKTIGKKIRLLRHQRGWSQDDVAKRLDISIPALSKIETGITDINLSRLVQVASLFDMSVIQLLTLNQNSADHKIGSELDSINKKLMDREAEVINLQKKVIELFEEIVQSKVTA
jgi:transcriptional regulator with XRE-family HTH domain